MDNKKLTNRLLADSNYSMLSLSPFVASYIEKLVYDIATYVDNTIRIGNINIPASYSGENEISQEITGIPNGYSVINGPEEALIAFAAKYSSMNIDSFDFLAKEAIADFLNLNNGLFLVYLSENNICELSLNVPKQNGNYEIDHTLYKSIIVIPIIFSFGTLNFLLCEK